MIRQDATVNVGDPALTSVTVGADPARPTTHEREALIEDVATFVLGRWTALWPLLGSDRNEVA